MAYMVEYGKTIEKMHLSATGKRPGRNKRRAMAVLCFAVIVFTAICYRDRIRDFLISEDTVVAVSALDGLVCDVSEGRDVGDAVTAFCREIIQNAIELQ